MSDPRPPDTRTPVITQAHVDAIVAALQRGGANVNVADPRVSAVQNWIIATVGAGVVGALLWMAQTLSTAVAIQTQHTQILQDHEQRIRDQERRP